MENIADKIVVITGASSGLGAETARHLVNARRQGCARRAPPEAPGGAGNAALR